jgi:hypothetical protein
MSRLALGLLSGLASAGQAQAHAFQSGADAYGQFTEGFGVALTDPPIVLVLVASFIAVSLADPKGFPRALPFLAAGIIGGGLIAPAIPEAGVLATLTVALAAGLLGVLRWTKGLAVLALLAGVTAAMTGLAGHTFSEVPVLLKLGLATGILLIAAASAALTAMALERFPYPATAILARVAASWCAAIALLLLAFVVKGLS